MRLLMQTTLALAACGLLAESLLADPCGMVPPIYQGPGVPISRVGEQITYVMYKDGVETFVIRPGFNGKVEEFGMLIPFPAPPALRKVPDHIFPHVAAAIDPPEVVVDLRLRFRRGALGAVAKNANAAPRQQQGLELKRDEVRVVKEEAVGMYEVAVLEAGSAAALKKWMDQHGYKYPEGMDKVCEEYVEDKWCFVAVKTKVGSKKEVDPQPGQREVNPNLPSGATFDGYVQAMGFRFPSDQLVVPMRLSAFNEGELRNIVYLMTDGPKKIRSIPEEYVVRQISGKDLFRNLTEPLPLRIIGGTEKDIPDWQRKNLPAQRNPQPKNGAAAELFASDLLAIGTKELSLPHEEREKELLRIGEHFGLRGAETDKLNADVLKEETSKTVKEGLKRAQQMTLTVVDGDFPREVLGSRNLTFASYEMPGRRNKAKFYDAKIKGPAGEKQGVLKLGALGPRQPAGWQFSSLWESGISWILLGCAVGLGIVVANRKSKLVLGVALAVAVGGFATLAQAADEATADLIEQLGEDKQAEAAVAKLVEKAGGDDRKEVVNALIKTAKQDDSITRRGWAIAALGDIGGLDVDEHLLNIHASDKYPMLVRTWAAAARVKMTKTTAGLIEKASLVQQFPALGRPIGLRVIESLNQQGEEVSPEQILKISLQVPKLAQALGPPILAFGPKKLAKVMATAEDQRVRRQAAGYIGALAQQGEKDVPQAVIDVYKFDPDAKDVAWKGGPLFLPNLGWNKEGATELVGHLIRWHLWCDRNGKQAEQNQINNNLVSIALRNSAGYQPRGNQTVQWLEAWGQAVGKEELAKILKEQGVEDTAKYANVLKKL